MSRSLLVLVGYLAITFFIIMWSVVQAGEARVPVSEDTYLQEGFPDVTPSDNRNLYLGWDTLYSKKRTRLLLQFSTLAIINPQALVAANLFLYQYYPQSSSSYEVDVYAQVISWSSISSTWNTQPGPGQLLVTQRFAAGIGWESLAVTSAVQEALLKRQLLLFQLRATNELKPGGVFWSSQCAFAPDEPRCQGEQPYLILTYDDTPPAVPGLDQEPPITNGTTNTLEWSKVKDDYSSIIEYQLQASQSHDFAEHIESSWVASTYYTFGSLHEGNNYFRIRARDRAGNMTGWSTSTSSYQDQKPPVITTFTASPKTISPNSSTSRGVRDYTVVSFAAEDPSFDEGRFVVYATDRTVVYEKAFTKRIESLHWPTTTQQKLSEGRYYLYYQAIDDFGQTRSRGPLVVTIDNTAPVAPLIIRPSANVLTNVRRVRVSFQQDELLPLTITIDKRTITTVRKKSGSVEPPVLAEGKHTVVVHNTDTAGNRGESSVSFTVDRTPPTRPIVELAITKSSSVLKIKGESNASVVITQNGRKLPPAILTRGQVQYPVIVSSVHEARYTWAVQLRDTAGNISKTSFATHAFQFGIGTAVPSPNKFPEELPSVTCTIVMREVAVTQATCDPLVLALRTVEAEPTRSDWLVRLYGAGQIALTLQVQYWGCATMRWYDPRTWFCLSQLRETRQLTPSAGIPLIDTLHRTRDGTSHALIVSWQGQEKSRLLGEGFTNTDLGGTSFWLQGQVRWYWFDEITQQFMVLTRPYVQSNEVVSTAFPPLLEGVRPLLSWLFSSFVGVTQWHGRTAYQNPHAGIDFGVSKAPIHAPADGVVVSAGYDKYGGTCYQGGNYVGIRHHDNLYTYYFHLTHYRNEQGRAWRVGNTIKRGQQLGVTGNSGAFACQQLRDHLHFEVRTCRSAKCHVDPVPYFDIDWNKIPTVNRHQYPGRLQGDNPHPGL